MLFRSVLCPDLRGHGRSRCEDLFWDEPMLARDMLRLLNAVGVERAHMVGHSMGGDVAMSCAVMQPERALSLVSIGSAGLANPALARYLDRLAPERAERARHSAFFAHLQAQHQAAHRGDWRRMFRQTIESCMQYPDFSPADLARLRMPFLLLYGEKDGLVLPEEMAPWPCKSRIFRVRKTSRTIPLPLCMWKQPFCVVTIPAASCPRCCNILQAVIE